jgi:flagellar biosynthetic protein FliO
MGFWDYAKAVAVICAVVGAAYYLTRFLAKAGSPLRKATGVKLVGSLPLAKDRSVALVEIGAQVYVLGVSAQHVERLDKFPRSELFPAGEETQPPPPDFTASFRNELDRRLKKLRGHG